MNSKTLLRLAAILIATSPLGSFACAADGTDAARGIAATESLGRLNGQALACSLMPEAARIKQLAIQHLPKTATYGTAFDDATKAGFARQTASGACPPAEALQVQLEAVAARLKIDLPPGSAP